MITKLLSFRAIILGLLNASASSIVEDGSQVSQRYAHGGLRCNLRKMCRVLS